MVEIDKFERLTGRELSQYVDSCRQVYDPNFEQYFAKHHELLDWFHFRCAVAIMFDHNSESIRDILALYVDSADIGISATVRAFFHQQQALGYIHELPW